MTVMTFHEWHFMHLSWTVAHMSEGMAKIVHY